MSVSRYNNTFSPMALNNLNNPYSPQPSTPVACHPEDHFPIVGPGGVTIMAPVNVVQGGMGQPMGGGTVPVTSAGGGGGANGGGGGSVISNQQYQSLLVQLQDNQPLRSRHSSAESEPAMRSGGVAASLVLSNDGRQPAGGRFDEPLSSTAGHVGAGQLQTSENVTRSKSKQTSKLFLRVDWTFGGGVKFIAHSLVPRRN